MGKKITDKSQLDYGRNYEIFEDGRIARVGYSKGQDGKFRDVVRIEVVQYREWGDEITHFKFGEVTGPRNSEHIVREQEYEIPKWAEPLCNWKGECLALQAWNWLGFEEERRKWWSIVIISTF